MAPLGPHEIRQFRLSITSQAILYERQIFMMRMCVQILRSASGTRAFIMHYTALEALSSSITTQVALCWKKQSMKYGHRLRPALDLSMTVVRSKIVW